jgi:hypothetical protein
MLFADIHKLINLKWAAVKANFTVAHFVFMELTYHCPKFKFGNNPPAVYRLVFDTGYFYIGSSKKVKTRFTTWRTTLKRMAFNNKSMLKKLPSFSAVFMEIIEYTTVNERRVRETYHLEKEINHPLCLNKHRTALGDGSTKKLVNQERHKRTYIPHPRVLKEKLPKVYKPLQNKAVIKYDAIGNEICRFVSISDAAKDAGVRRDSMREHLLHVKLKSGKPYYRTVGDTRPYSVGKKEKEPKPPIQYPEMSGGKFVLDTQTGVFYYSVRDLCDLYPFKHKTMCAKLSGDKRNNTQFVYA